MADRHPHDKPGLWWDGASYRLTSVQFQDDSLVLEFSLGSYFDFIDWGGILAYEAAKVALTSRTLSVSRSSLRVRRLLGDPFDVGARPTYLGVNVLTLIREPTSGITRFLMHHRTGSVASAAGVHHVVPAGEFQPSGSSPDVIHSDLDLWRCIMREYAEELLGRADAGGLGQERVRYTSDEPYVSLDRAMCDGRVRVWILGLGLDPLTLKAELLCAAVFDAGTFNEIFDEGLVDRNQEGLVLVGSERRGFLFDESGVSPFCREPDCTQTLPAAVACLRLAWKHRNLLIGS